MSLLDTLTILFDTDGKKASKDVDELNDKLNDTEKSAGDATKGIDEMGSSANNAGQMFGELAKMAGTALASYLAFGAIKAQVMKTAQMTDQIGKFGQTLGLNVKQLDAWGEAAARSGGSASAFQGSVAGLQQQLTQIQFGGGSQMIQSLGMIGISAFDANGNLRDTFDILGDVADQFKQMPPARAYAIGGMLGLDQGTILLLQQGRYNIEQLVEQQLRFGSASAQAYKAAADFDDSLDNLDRSFRSIWQSINTFVLPPITALINGFNEAVTFLRENQDFAVGFFGVLGGAILALALPPMISLAAATLAATWPILAIGAAIVALAALFGLLYDDVKHYIDGQDSLLGRLLDRYEWLKDGVVAVFDFIKKAWQELLAVIDWAKLLVTNPQAAIDELEDYLKGIGQSILNGVTDATDSAIEYLRGEFSKFWGWLKSLFDFSELFSGLTGAVSKGVDDVKEWLGLGVSDGSSNVMNTPAARTPASHTPAAQVINSYNSNPLNTATPSMLTNNNNRSIFNTNNFSFSNQIDASSMTPDQLKGAFADDFLRQLSSAQANIDDGVAY